MSNTDIEQDIVETRVYFGSEARKKLYDGIKIAAEAVGATMGPRGRTVLIQKKGKAPVLTKDGVTVSRSIKLPDPVEKMGAELILEAANRTNEVAGDGTTTSTMLTYALVSEGMRLLEAGYSPKKLVEGIEIAARSVEEELRKLSRRVETREQIEHVGTISANGDKNVGSIIADAMENVGNDGIITVEDAKGMNTFLEHVEGLMFERGYISPYFASNSERMIASYQDARVLVTDRKISTLSDIIPVLEEINRTKVPLLIIAEDVDGDALQGLILNKLKTDLRVVAVRAPGYGKHKEQILGDICTLTGAQLISPSTGLALNKATSQHLGKLKKFVVDSKSTTLVGTGATADAVSRLADELRDQLTDITLSDSERTILRARIAKLGSGVAIIKVGGHTEVEMLERKYRIEDALHATRAAADEGIVPGGGIALMRASAKLESVSNPDHEVFAGIGTVMKACRYPFRKIITNAGGSPDVVEQKILEGSSGDPWNGYDSSSAKYTNMLETGIIDPVKVTRTALANAKSVAVSFLTLDAVIAENKP